MHQWLHASTVCASPIACINSFVHQQLYTSTVVCINGCIVHTLKVVGINNSKHLLLCISGWASMTANINSLLHQKDLCSACSTVISYTQFYESIVLQSSQQNLSQQIPHRGFNASHSVKNITVLWGGTRRLIIRYRTFSEAAVLKQPPFFEIAPLCVTSVPQSSSLFALPPPQLPHLIFTQKKRQVR